MHRLSPFFFCLFLLSTHFNLSHSLTINHRGHQQQSNRLFLDTAIQSDWTSLLPLGIFHGITTNPTLLETAGHECTISSLHSLAKQALSIPNCHEFMCQTWGESCDDMYHNGMALSEIDRENIVIKVPVTFEGTKAASKLINSGVRVCLTACYSSDQMVIAAGLGADYIAPYLGRMTDNGKDGKEECLRMQRIQKAMNSQTRVLVASIRDVNAMTDLMADSGDMMDTFTFSPDVARQLFYEQLTVQAAADFEAAAIRRHATSSVSSPPYTQEPSSSSQQAQYASVNTAQEEMTSRLQTELENSQRETQLLQNDIQRLKDEITSNQEVIAAYRQSSQQNKRQSMIPQQSQSQQSTSIPQQRMNNVPPRKKKNKEIFKWSD